MAMRSAAVVAMVLAMLSPLALAGRSLKTGFIVKGRVFCDTCRAGFETPATTYITGAKVKVSCRDRFTEALRYTAEGLTDKTGTYRIPVVNDHEAQICESVLVSSPESSCANVVDGRDRARVVLTFNNGIPSKMRLANSMGFQVESVGSECAEVMKMYQTDEEEA